MVKKETDDPVDTEKETDPGHNIREHPILAKLVAQGVTDAMTLRGYIGPSTAEGYVSLYQSLDNLSNYIEISRGDILHHAELPESVLPLGATLLWVKKDAKITYRIKGTVTEMSPVATSADHLPDLQRGRLRIQFRRPILREGACTSSCMYCQSHCRPTCQSRCNSKPHEE